MAEQANQHNAIYAAIKAAIRTLVQGYPNKIG